MSLEVFGIKEAVAKALLARLWKQLEGKVVEGASSGGLVRILLSLRHEVVEVAIAPTALEQEEALGELVKEAANSALRAAREAIREEARRLLGDVSWWPDLG